MRQVASIRVRWVIVAVAVAAAVAVVPRATAEEGYDLMRVITTQWVKPLLVIAFDKSGSMRWTTDENDSTWNFRYSDSVQGYVYSQADWTDGWRGRGQGFWMRVASTGKLATPPTDFLFDGYRTAQGWVDATYPDNIYTPQTEPKLFRGDLIRIIDYPIDSVNGIYMVARDSLASGANPGWWYTKFYKMNADGTFSNTIFTFPLVNGNDVRPFSFERVTLNTDPATLQPTPDIERAGHDARWPDWLYLHRDLNVRPGDIVQVRGFSDPTENTYYLLRYRGGASSAHPGYDYWRVSRITSGGTFPNSDFRFRASTEGYDWSVTARVVRLETSPVTVWYFVPPSRMAIAKNVLGNAVPIYEPAVAPSGWDDRNKPYYLFDGAGPVNGAWKEWRGSGDNGSGGVWHNWNASTGRPPAGDPAYTTEVTPSNLLARFSQVADLGLVYYPRSYDCGSGEPAAVQVDPDDDDQAAVLAQLYQYFTYVRSGGLSPGGSTPTRAALLGAGKELKRVYGVDPKKSCGRTYGVLLLTDGQSNYCNNGGSACWRDPWTLRCDGSYPGFDCPSRWERFPAGISDELWFMTVDSKPLHVRTWAVGLSQGIGPCELNYTAYKGRTDAASPNQDAGFDLAKDPWLTPDNRDVFDYEVLDPTDGDPGHGMYAYFASGVDELRRALLDILSSLGAGDYTTSAPSVAGSALTAANMAFVPSTEYPSWRGHLRAFEQVYDAATQKLVWRQRWDAGQVLANGNNGFARRIFTWDPSDNNRLVEITAANAARLNAICGGCGITSDVVTFIRGGGRPWVLGALINSTPAVVGPPENWEKGTAEKHADFAAEYASRHTQVWVGASDGMVHAFDILDGTEILAIVPPDLLDVQVDLAARWWSNPSKFPMGQPRHPGDHVYGVASSLRFADVWDTTRQMFRTMLYVTEGPGGTGIHALDVTHPFPGRTVDGTDYPADPNYDPAKPFEPLWGATRDGEAGTTVRSQLGQTFSVPAVGIVRSLASGGAESVLLLNQGWWPNAANNSRPWTLVLDPIDGSLISSSQPSSNASTFRVGNQAFADGVIWQTDASKYLPDNVVDEALVADLNGTVWSLTGNKFTSRSALFQPGGEQPIYYSPAVAAYPVSNPSYDLFAFASGSFYEKNFTVTSVSSGFVPKIYIGVRSLTTGSTSSVSVPITKLPLPAGVTNSADTDGNGKTFTPGAQVIAPPLLLVPSSGTTGKPFALYLVYDPKGDVCVGKSYIVKVEFDPQNLTSLQSNPGNYVTSYEAGKGAAGGFAIAGERVIVSQSGVGEGQQASLIEVPDLRIPPGNRGDLVRWWMELQ